MKRTLWAIAGAALVVSMTACSSGKKADKKTSAASTPTTSTTTSASPSSTTSSAVPLTEAQVQAALLKGSDLPGGFTDATFTKSTKPQPCAAAGSPPFSVQTSPQINVGATLDHATPAAALDEQIYVYADAATAAKALMVGKEGLNCASGTVYYTDGTKSAITISKPTDVATDLSVDSGFAWQLQNKNVQGTQVAFALGPLVVTLSFAAATGTDTTSLPDPITVAKAAITKIKSS